MSQPRWSNHARSPCQGALPPHLAQQDPHLVSPAAFVERCHSDPQVQLRVVHPHVPTVDAAACKRAEGKVGLSHQISVCTFAIAGQSVHFKVTSKHQAEWYRSLTRVKHILPIFSPFLFARHTKDQKIPIHAAWFFLLYVQVLIKPPGFFWGRHLHTSVHKRKQRNQDLLAANRETTR